MISSECIEPKTDEGESMEFFPTPGHRVYLRDTPAEDGDYFASSFRVIDPNEPILEKKFFDFPGGRALDADEFDGVHTSFDDWVEGRIDFGDLSYEDETPRKEIELHLPASGLPAHDELDFYDFYRNARFESEAVYDLTDEEEEDSIASKLEAIPLSALRSEGSVQDWEMPAILPELPQLEPISLSQSGKQLSLCLDLSEDEENFKAESIRSFSSFDFAMPQILPAFSVSSDLHTPAFACDTIAAADFENLDIIELPNGFPPMSAKNSVDELAFSPIDGCLSPTDECFEMPQLLPDLGDQYMQSLPSGLDVPKTQFSQSWIIKEEFANSEMKAVPSKEFLSQYFQNEMANSPLELKEVNTNTLKQEKNTFCFDNLEDVENVFPQTNEIQSELDLYPQRTFSNVQSDKTMHSNFHSNGMLTNCDRNVSNDNNNIYVDQSCVETTPTGKSYQHLSFSNQEQQTQNFIPAQNIPMNMNAGSEIESNPEGYVPWTYFVMGSLQGWLCNAPSYMNVHQIQMGLYLVEYANLFYYWNQGNIWEHAYLYNRAVTDNPPTYGNYQYSAPFDDYGNLSGVFATPTMAQEKFSPNLFSTSTEEFSKQKSPTFQYQEQQKQPHTPSTTFLENEYERIVNNNFSTSFSSSKMKETQGSDSWAPLSTAG